ncbi:SpaA isopeptide-forming pilin-related protein, partial [Blautia sp. HCP28S3_G10]|uniref:SpaA isopeptide-forming pilin-related protein n=1 Tax=Blautia sp. HCP28S3_G10 TaxID=3438908 RepID=UPI003F8A2F28
KTDGDKNEAQNVTNVNGKITFADLAYDKAGTYEYEVAEVQAVPNGYTADKTVYTVTVTVIDNKEIGKLEAAVSYKNGDVGVDKIVFRNTSKVSTAFSVKKTVNGADGKAGVEGFDPEETYNFELTPVTEGAPMPTDESGKTVSVVNGETGTFGQITYTEAGKTYEYNITEKAGSTPGMSYDTTPHKVTVTVSETYPLAATVKYDTDQDNLTVNNQYNGLTVKVSKRALKGDEAFALAGAKLQLIDADDQEKPVKEWVSGEAPEEIKGLIPGKTYILREISAPDGYTVAEDTQFVLNRDGTLEEKTTTVYDKESNTLVVNDKLTSVFINKVTEDGKVLAGAILQVLDAEGKAVTLNDKEVQWETTDQPYEITGLKTDTVYTLHEVKAPDGYTLAADINFTIGTDGKVLIGKEAQADNTIVMTDTLTRVEINKVDAVDGKVLAGAKLQVLGKDGKAAEVNGKKLEWTSTEKAHEITGLKTDTVYTLHETVAPTGYDISADTTFTIGTDGKISKSGTTAKVSDDGILLVED